LIKIIPKEEIPSWNFGDVAVKTFSFGDTLRLAKFTSKMKSFVNSEGRADMETQFKDDTDIEEVSLFTLASGIHYVKSLDSSGFVINSDMITEDKVKVLYKIDLESGKYLIQQVQEINKNDDSQKKN